MKNSARGHSSTGSELKAVEEACREASRTVEPCELCVSMVNSSFTVNPEDPNKFNGGALCLEELF